LHYSPVAEGEISIDYLDAHHEILLKIPPVPGNTRSTEYAVPLFFADIHSGGATFCAVF
jgi:hypothetical protein